MDSIEPSRNFKTLRVYLSTSKHPGYLRFDIKGTYGFEDFKRALRLMRDTCVERRTPCDLEWLLEPWTHLQGG